MVNNTELFARIFENLKVKNYEEIARRRDEIAKALNKKYRDLDSSKKNQLMVGSYGRHTAINGISDLDMLYILPANLRSKYRSPEGPAKVLDQTRNAIIERYPNTEVKVRQLVVVVQFENFKFEVQPVFPDEDDFLYPDTKLKLWRKTKPKKEIEAVKNAEEETSGKYRKLCRLTRAWKNKHKVNINGLLIDTLVFNFQNMQFTELRWGTGAHPRIAPVRRLTIEKFHPRVIEASGPLFADGHFSEAVGKAFVSVEVRVRDLIGSDQSGTKLMDEAFGGKAPKLFIALRQGRSGQDEQAGFHALFRGAMLGIRNPGAHELASEQNPQEALEYLALASLLHRKLDCY